jgi:hypothetical protein
VIARERDQNDTSLDPSASRVKVVNGGRALPIMVDRETAKKIDKLLSLNVLDRKSSGSIYLDEKFKKAFDEIAKERRFDEFTVDDIRLIAARSSEWRQVD